MDKTVNLKHVAVIREGSGHKHLLLRKLDQHLYEWYTFDSEGQESKTDISSDNIEEAIRLAHRKWKHESFRPLMCGFRYTLPERDEHGLNALFHQMAASYSSPNGIYFDEEMGCNCFVQNASTEARSFLNEIKKT